MGNRMEENHAVNHIMNRVLKGDAAYPKRLSQIADPPRCLYYYGNLPKEEKLSVAIIGARDCSEYGRQIAGVLGKKLGEAGVQIISGMARGIDGIAQESALDAGGTSFGILGCGVDICYPRQNRRLYDKLCERGGVISEYEPGTAPKPFHFPPRNRIVSGLSDIVVVVESRVKSGTLITVDMALEQGKEVYVVPGRLTDSLSAGCNRLMKMGAGILLDTEEFLEELWSLYGRSRSEPKKNRLLSTVSEKGQITISQWMKEMAEPEGVAMEKRALGEVCSGLSPECKVVFELLDYYPKSVEQLLGELPGEHHNIQIQLQLMRLCTEGLAVQVSPGYFRKSV